jgi:mRNA interferase RelE/StbE
MYNVIWTPTSQKELAELEKELIRRIVDRVEQIKHSPYHFIDHLTDIDAWRLRVGDYRVILDMDENEKALVILKVGHRKNIYKKI